LYDLGYDVSNKIICYYQGAMDLDGNYVLVPQNIPSECDAILYVSLYINQESTIDIDESKLNNFYSILYLHDIMSRNIENLNLFLFLNLSCNLKIIVLPF